MKEELISKELFAGLGALWANIAMEVYSNKGDDELMEEAEITAYSVLDSINNSNCGSKEFKPEESWGCLRGFIMSAAEALFVEPKSEEKIENALLEQFVIEKLADEGRKMFTDDFFQAVNDAGFSSESYKHIRKMLADGVITSVHKRNKRGEVIRITVLNGVNYE